MMIKKSLTTVVSIVLGNMIMTTSFAWPPSENCVDARLFHNEILSRVQKCRDNHNCGELNLQELRECKTQSLAIAKETCPHGSYVGGIQHPLTDKCGLIWCVYGTNKCGYVSLGMPSNYLAECKDFVDEYMSGHTYGCALCTDLDEYEPDC